MITQASPKHDVQDYIDGVLSGEIVTGSLVRLAVQRHVQDLEKSGERGFYFDEEIAEEACLFFPWVCKHSIGEWDGKPFFLQPWQQFIIWSLMGWRKKRDSTRRYKTAYISVGRKNGKTTLLAGLTLYLMYADEPFEPGAEIYIAATKIPQACKMYDEARRMVEASPSILKRSLIRKSPKSINYPKFASKIEPIASDNSTDGLNTHAVLIDELHEWKAAQRDALEKLTGGGGSRRQPLFVTITTAGNDQSQIWIEEDDYAVKTVEAAVTGNVVDDSKFVYVARIDDTDDPLDPGCWAKANPNLGESVKLSFLQEEANEAAQKPSATNKFIRYYCNRRVAASEREISAEMWQKGNQPLAFNIGAEGHGGIDLARSNDWAAIAACFPIRNEAGDIIRHEIISKAWTCKHGQFRVEHEPFRTWISEGLLYVCDGDQIDFSDIKREIIKWHKLYNIATWAYDPAWSTLIVQQLNEEEGITGFAFKQNHFKYNEPCVSFVKELCAERIFHGGDKVLEWQAGNLIYHRNHEGLAKPDKGNKASKIDGMVAVLMAYSECLFSEKIRLNYYENNNVEMG